MKLKNRVSILEKDTNKGKEMLDYLYGQCLNGIPRISKPVEELALDYTNKYGYSDEAIAKLIKNQISKKNFMDWNCRYKRFICKIWSFNKTSFRNTF